MGKQFEAGNLWVVASSRDITDDLFKEFPVQVSALLVRVRVGRKVMDRTIPRAVCVQGTDINQRSGL